MERNRAEQDAVDPDRWHPRAVWSVVLRTGCALLPLAVGVVCAVVASRFVPRPRGLWPQVAWVAAILAVSTPFVLVAGRLARRILRLAVLLELSLRFPDRAPSRFALALRTGNTKRLAAWAEEVRRAGVTNDVSKAAEIVVTLAAALNVHDRATRGHSERVRAFTDMLAEELGLDGAEQDRLRWAGLLHDIGKLSVSAEILNKTGKPDAEEWEALKRHPVEGARITAPLRSWLGVWGDAIEHHHERFDGRGYPHGLAGPQISYGGRIVAVADSYDTMTSARSYKRPLSVRAGRTELAKGAGSHFDPDVVRAFLNISVRRLWWVVGPVGWLAEIPVLGLAPRAVLVSLTASSAVQGVFVAAAIAAGAVIGGGASVHGEHDPGPAHHLAPAPTGGDSAVAPHGGRGPSTRAPTAPLGDTPPPILPGAPRLPEVVTTVETLVRPITQLEAGSLPTSVLPTTLPTIPPVTVPAPTVPVPTVPAPTVPVPTVPVPTVPVTAPSATVPAPTVPVTAPAATVPVPTVPVPTLPVSTPTVPAPTLPEPTVPPATPPTPTVPPL